MTDIKKQDYDPTWDIVTGFSDGIMIPFALSAGLAGAMVSNQVIVIAGMSLIAAGSIAMGLGGYFTAKSEYPRFNVSRKIRQQKDPIKLKQDLSQYFGRLGLSGQLRDKAAEELVEDRHKWEQFLANFRTGNIVTSRKVYRLAGLYIAFSYVLGGLFPLLPYIFYDITTTALAASAIVTLSLLFLLGLYKANATGGKGVQFVLVETATGIVAGAAAYMVGRLFLP